MPKSAHRLLKKKILGFWGLLECLEQMPECSGAGDSGQQLPPFHGVRAPGLPQFPPLRAALDLAYFSRSQCLPGPWRHLRLWNTLAHSNLWGMYHRHSQVQKHHQGDRDLPKVTQSVSLRTRIPTQAYLLPEPTFFVLCRVSFPGSRAPWKSAGRDRKEKYQSLTLGKECKKRESSSRLSGLTASPAMTLLRTKGCFQWLMAWSVKDPYRGEHRAYMCPCFVTVTKRLPRSGCRPFFHLQTSQERGKEGCGWQTPHAQPRPQ